MNSFLDNASCEALIFLASIGIIWTCIILLSFASKLYRAVRIFIIARLLPKDLRIHGKWAVITGGSSGIGRSYAHHLAKRGFNIVVISNELDALKSTVRELESRHKVECSYIYANLADGIEVYEDVAKQLVGKDIALLLNGAGIAGKSPCRFLKETDRNIILMINLHITAVVFMTLKAMRLMLTSKGGFIVNISSAATFRPLPYWHMYTSTKAFSDCFTRSLYWEQRDNNSKVSFQSLKPFYVATRMTKKLSGFVRFCGLVPDGDSFVASAVNTVSLVADTCGYWLHELMWFGVKLLPGKFVDFYVLMGTLRKRK